MCIRVFESFGCFSACVCVFYQQEVKVRLASQRRSGQPHGEGHSDSRHQSGNSVTVSFIKPFNITMAETANQQTSTVA